MILDYVSDHDTHPIKVFKTLGFFLKKITFELVMRIERTMIHNKSLGMYFLFNDNPIHQSHRHGLTTQSKILYGHSHYHHQ